MAWAPWGSAWVWFVAAALCATCGLALRRRVCWARWWWIGPAVGLGLALGGRAAVLEHTRAVDSIGRYVGATAQLASVRGVIDRPVTSTERTTTAGGLGRFAYRAPGVATRLRVEQVRVDGVWTPASGRLRLRLREPEHRLHRGLRIEADGWLTSIPTPANPGEPDWRLHAQRQGVEGVLSVPGRANWRGLGESSWASPLRWFRQKDRFAEAVKASLWRGLAPEDARRGVAAALLVGDRSALTPQTYAEFRAAGLAHTLSLSGAHLGIVLGLAWFAVRLVVHRPRKAALVAAAVLALFLLSAEVRTPLIRAAAMGAAALLAVGAGRPGSAMRAMAVSAIALLLWDPRQVVDPGFQLSYLAVGAILMLSQPLARRMWRAPAWQPDPGAPTSVATGPAWLGWVAVQSFAVSLAALCASAALVAHHFGMTTAWGAPVSLAAVVPLTLVLGVGYVKALVGLVFPSVSAVLAPVLRVSLDALTGLAREASGWPGAGVGLGAAPSLAWAIGCTAVVLAWLGGAFAQRRITGLACVVLLGVWAGWGAGVFGPARWAPAGGDLRFVLNAERDALSWTALSVGDGSAHLLRSGDAAALVDCGSGGWPEVGSRAVAPALRAMGVRRLDWALVTHGDLDHFVGLLDLAVEVPIGRVYVGPDVFEQALGSPGGPEAALLSGLQDLDVPVEQVAAGWSVGFGQTQVACLWPPSDPAARADLKPGNDRSAVIRVEAAGRRVLLAGDVQADAMRVLLEDPESLRADAAAIPHHGGYVPGVSERWVEAVGAGVWVQSSSRRRQRDARWLPIFATSGAARYATAEHGAVRVVVSHSGAVSAAGFRDGDR
ncbi:MAG: ComEC/Rec2 family competence protein [Planctomycetota bacterium]